MLQGSRLSHETGRTGEEIARLLAQEAERVYVSARTFPGDVHAEMLPNLERVAMLVALPPQGGARFADGRLVQDLDAVVYCTGAFPVQFL